MSDVPDDVFDHGEWDQRDQQPVDVPESTWPRDKLWTNADWAEHQRKAKLRSAAVDKAFPPGFPEIDDTTSDEHEKQHQEVKSWLDEKYKGALLPNPNTAQPQMTPQQYGVVPGLASASMCLGCGSVVLMQALHDQWHFRLSQIRGVLS